MKLNLVTTVHAAIKARLRCFETFTFECPR